MGCRVHAGCRFQSPFKRSKPTQDGLKSCGRHQPESAVMSCQLSPVLDRRMRFCGLLERECLADHRLQPAGRSLGECG